MPRIKKKELERIFKTSDSADELFDNFRIAIDNKLKDAYLYKILLWNRALSADEILMYAEKICKVHPTLSYQIYYWVGQVFSSISIYGEYHDKAFEYFQKAAKVKPSEIEPYLAITKLYHFDLNVPEFEKIVRFMKKGIDSTELKSKLCFALSKLCKKKGDKETEKTYQKLGEKYQKEGK
jgi:tetratricopeptide (TPR) repeat protein